MTRSDFENFLVLYDQFIDKCNIIASIFAEASNGFLYADNWTVDLPYTTCTGHREPGYIRGKIDDEGLEINMPFSYLYMTEEELKTIVKNRPEEVQAMIVRTKNWD